MSVAMRWGSGLTLGRAPGMGGDLKENRAGRLGWGLLGLLLGLGLRRVPVRGWGLCNGAGLRNQPNGWRLRRVGLGPDLGPLLSLLGGRLGLAGRGLGLMGRRGLRVGLMPWLRGGALRLGRRRGLWSGRRLLGALGVGMRH